MIRGKLLKILFIIMTSYHTYFLRVFHINICSIRNKQMEIPFFLIKHDFDIMIWNFQLNISSYIIKAKRKQWQHVVVLVCNNIKLDILNTGSSVDTDIEAIGILLKDVKTSQIISTFLNNIWNNRIM